MYLLFYAYNTTPIRDCVLFRIAQSFLYNVLKTRSLSHLSSSHALDTSLNFLFIINSPFLLVCWTTLLLFSYIYYITETCTMCKTCTTTWKLYPIGVYHLYCMTYRWSGCTAWDRSMVYPNPNIKSWYVQSILRGLQIFIYSMGQNRILKGLF